MCWLSVVILDNYCCFYFQCAINLMMGPLISACSVRMKNGAKSSRPCFGKTPTEVREVFGRVRFVSQFLLIIWDVFAPCPSPQSCSPRVTPSLESGKSVPGKCEKCPFHPFHLGITWIASGVWSLSLRNSCCRDRR